MNAPEKNKIPRCPYCVLDGQFRPLKTLGNGRQICENCGHIVFPEDRAFRCPCQECIKAQFSPRLRSPRG